MPRASRRRPSVEINSTAGHADSADPALDATSPNLGVLRSPPPKKIRGVAVGAGRSDLDRAFPPVRETAGQTGAMAVDLYASGVRPFEHDRFLDHVVALQLEITRDRTSPRPRARVWARWAEVLGAAAARPGAATRTRMRGIPGRSKGAWTDRPLSPGNVPCRPCNRRARSRRGACALQVLRQGCTDLHTEPDLSQECSVVGVRLSRTLSAHRASALGPGRPCRGHGTMTRPVVALRSHRR